VEHLVADLCADLTVRDVDEPRFPAVGVKRAGKSLRLQGLLGQRKGAVGVVPGDH
jgi:hypothetical protein